MESRWDVLSAVGAITCAWLLLRVAWGVARGVYVYLLPQARRGSPWLRAQGTWAVVTGATSGIGKAYAHELARRGLDVVLISRNLSKLELEAKEIERLHGRRTRVIQADFTGGLQIYGDIEAQLQGLEVGVLVNNVAMTYGRGVLRKLLDCENPAKITADMVNCNVLSVVQMTRIVLPQMVSRRRGVIINLSSVASLRSIPLLATYAASKVRSPPYPRAEPAGGQRGRGRQTLARPNDVTGAQPSGRAKRRPGRGRSQGRSGEGREAQAAGLRVPR